MILSRCVIKNCLCFSIAVIALNIILLTKPLGWASLFAEPTSESVYYVSPSGNDSNPGTESQPWRTIQKACNTLTPGDTVYVKAGQYNEKITVNVSGTKGGGYITIRNFENDVVIIDGTGISGSDIIYMGNYSGTSFQQDEKYCPPV